MRAKVVVSEMSDRGASMLVAVPMAWNGCAHKIIQIFKILTLLHQMSIHAIETFIR